MCDATSITTKKLKSADETSLWVGSYDVAFK